MTRVELSVFGKTTLDAVRLLHDNHQLDYKEAWTQAIANHTSSDSTRKKGCPQERICGFMQVWLCCGNTKTAGRTINGKRQDGYRSTPNPFQTRLEANQQEWFLAYNPDRKKSLHPWHSHH